MQMEKEMWARKASAGKSDPMRDMAGQSFERVEERHRSE